MARVPRPRRGGALLDGPVEHRGGGPIRGEHRRHVVDQGGIVLALFRQERRLIRLGPSASRRLEERRARRKRSRASASVPAGLIRCRLGGAQAPSGGTRAPCASRAGRCARSGPTRSRSPPPSCGRRSAAQRRARASRRAPELLERGIQREEILGQGRHGEVGLLDVDADERAAALFRRELRAVSIRTSRIARAAIATKWARLAGDGARFLKSLT